MKIRQGFVSNSSSSSFCAILYNGPKYWDIMKHFGIDELSKSEDYYKYPIYDYGRISLDNDLILFVDEYNVGIEIHRLLKNGATIPECKEKLKQKIKSLGVDVEDKHLHWRYGEIHS